MTLQRYEKIMNHESLNAKFRMAVANFSLFTLHFSLYFVPLHEI